MKIAVISDIHDRTDHLKLALDDILGQGCSSILCLGDIDSPFSLNTLVNLTETIPIDLVLGNNDFDISEFEQIERSHSRLTIHGMIASIAISNLRIGMIHLPDIALSMAKSKDYDFVFYGHTHQAHVQRVGSCILANPGEIMGRNGSVSFGILNTATQKFTIHYVTA